MMSAAAPSLCGQQSRTPNGSTTGGADGKERVSQGVVAGRALVLHARDRDLEQSAGVRQYAGRKAVGGAELAEPRRLDLGARNTFVDGGDRLADRRGQHVLQPGGV